MQSKLMSLAAAALALLAVPAFAQTTTATLSGVITDESGARIVGADLTARHLPTGLLRTAQTGADGRYVMPLLPVGPYELRADNEGFRTVRREVRLALGETTVADLALEVAAAEEVTVTAETPMVSTTSGELSYLVGEKAVRELPLNGRNYTDLALLQPGVIAFPHRDGGSVSSGSKRSTS